MSDIDRNEVPGQSDNSFEARTNAQIAKFTGELPDSKSARIMQIKSDLEKGKADRDLERLRQARIDAAREDLRSFPKDSTRNH